MKTTRVDFVNKKIIEEKMDNGKTYHLEQKQVMFVDFKNKNLKNCLNTSVYVEKEDLDMSNFSEPKIDSPWANQTDKSRVDHSEYLLEHFSDLDFSEILYFIDMGVLDKKKVAAKLNVVFKHEDIPDNIG